KNRNDRSTAGVGVMILRWDGRSAGHGRDSLVGSRGACPTMGLHRRLIGRELDNKDRISGRTVGCPTEEIGGRLTDWGLRNRFGTDSAHWGIEASGKKQSIKRRAR